MWSVYDCVQEPFLSIPQNCLDSPHVLLLDVVAQPSWTRSPWLQSCTETVCLGATEEFHIVTSLNHNGEGLEFS